MEDSESTKRKDEMRSIKAMIITSTHVHSSATITENPNEEPHHTLQVSVSLSHNRKLQKVKLK